MKKLLSAITVAAVLTIPGQAHAQTTLGPTLAFHNDLDFGIGAQLDMALPSLGEDIGFFGDFIYFFIDVPGIDNAWEVNGNISWDLPIEDRPIAPFVFGGLNVMGFSPEVGDGETEVGLNIGGAFRFDAGAFSPVVGVRAEIEGGDGVSVFGTIPFSLSD